MKPDILYEKWLDEQLKTITSLETFFDDVERIQKEADLLFDDKKEAAE